MLRSAMAPRGCDNRALLAAVRAAEPEAYLVYKPHPDVVAGFAVPVPVRMPLSSAMRRCRRGDPAAVQPDRCSPRAHLTGGV